MVPVIISKGIELNFLKGGLKGFPANSLTGGMGNFLRSYFKSIKKHPALMEELSELSKDLEKEVSAVEPLFMGMGTDLQTIHQNTGDLARNVLNWVGLLDDKNESGAFFTLRKLADMALEELLSCQKEIEEKLSQRKLVMEHLDSLSGIFVRVEKIGLLLKIVAMNIGIESARTHKSFELFSVVSMETSHLSMKIRQIADTSFEVLNSAGESQKALYHSLSQGLHHIRGMARNAGKIVHEAVGEIECLMAASRNAVEKAGVNSHRIREQVGELVAAIQFHDNMSQRIAHITKALKDAKILLDESLKNKSPENGKDSSLTAISIIHLQTMQLKGIIGEIRRIHCQGRDAFENILGEIDALLECLTRMSGDSSFPDSEKGKNNDPFEKLQTSFGSLAQVLLQAQELLNPARQSASKASETVEQIEKLVRDIHSIEFETHLMALNAIVKAAHLGQEGGALEVLAQEVKQSSDQSVGVLDRTTDLLQQITATAEKLQEEWAANEAGTTLNQAANTLSKVCRDFSKDSEAARIQAETIKKSISGLVSNLDFMPRLAENLSGCLERMEGSIQDRVPAPEKDSG
ncbi:MAG: methyl-accepting chemotaxis protein, partial [Proteobacteria bacterium]|nr:methyl-accepting chemotaxis protein [Pseudomonadota bacterium]